ncbi:MAG: flagellar basal body-associated FliL family protein [Bacteroidetes bacterium]|nr:flagellar basal body-associated FliL family protein [Bacteroidota bacterium]
MIEDDNISEIPAVASSAPEKKGGLNAKVFVIGIPLFVIQLVAVYFITANILLNKMSEKAAAAESAEEGTELHDSDTLANVELGKFIHSIDDIIVNPAGTKGKELLLASVAFDLRSEENKLEMEGKDILVKDLVISVLSSKSVVLLGNTSYRDTLRSEIQNKLVEFLPNIGVNKVYFSKYIIN